jgi:hypothetical protein
MPSIPAFSARKVLFHSDAQMFEIVEVADLGSFLFVVCGGVALYNRIIKVTSEEISLFNEGGSESLRDLIYEINKGKYEDREWQDERQAIYKRA